MFRQIVGFEIRYQLRQPLLWATSAIFAVVAFVATTTDALEIGGAIGSLNRNAPYVVVRMLGDMSLLGIFFVVAFVATAVLRDFERGTDEIVFSRPVRPRDLLLGRFSGSVLAACLCFTIAALGLLIGGFMPWLDPARVGPFSLRPYAYGLGMLAFPTFVIAGAFFFAVASRVRRIAYVYVVLVALLVAYYSAVAMFGDLEGQRTAAFLDPFGLVAFDHLTRYWTIAEKNGRVPGLVSDLLWSRLLWLGLGLAALTWAVGRFRYEQVSRRRTRVAPTAAIPAEPVTVRVREAPSFGTFAAWSQLRSQLRLEVGAVVLGLPFVLILSFSLINVLSNMGQLDLMLGTPVWPVTHLMLLAVRAGYSFLLVVIVGFYAGESIWRERSLRADGLLDALPIPTWVPLAAKVLALWVASAVFIGAGIVGLAGYQLYHGYTHLQPLLYAQGFVVETVPFLLIAVLAVFLQVVLNQKFAGYLATLAFLVSNGVLGALHFDHNLYRYAAAPAAPYSDMNGWGHFAAGLFWFDAYWSLAASLLLVIAYLGWVRGGEPAWRLRWRAARQRWGGPLRWATFVLLVGFGLVGGFIFYNTNVLNEYVPSDEGERRLAAYEKKYGQYRKLSQPRIVAAHADVDIFPEERRAEIRGTYRVANRSAAAIAALHVSIPSRLRILKLDLPPHRTVVDDRRLAYAVYELETPLAPGQETSLAFDLEIRNPGFVNGNPDNSVVENGTFFHSQNSFPSLGYQESRQLEDPAARRRQGLPPIVRMAKIDDAEARLRNDLGPDADWLDFDTTVSTSLDQVAVAPGDLEREWTGGGRRYFHYKSDTPIPKFFTYLSARYAVRRGSWNGIGVEVFYHPSHAYNVDRMIDAMKKTLAYMTENFSPYQHRNIRIVEYPRYSRRAASFPNTIPFSEAIGFIARLRDPESIDYPFYVTAHEVAHQWWGYQVLGADVQGTTMLSETMAQYSALMVMEREYGPEKMHRFLRYELDRYLSGRGSELVAEMPLELVEHQAYIHYSKGSLALYALKDYLGESVLNGALKRYIASVRFQAPPYTVSRDLLAFVAEVTPEEKRHLLDDLFRSITLYELQAVEARSRALSEGRFEVTLKARARKLHADEKGVETEVPLDDWIDVGVLGDKTTLYLEKQHVTGPELEVRMVVAGRPLRAGIDPYNKLIDRAPDDNVRAVVQE